MKREPRPKMNNELADLLLNRSTPGARQKLLQIIVAFMWECERKQYHHTKEYMQKRRRVAA